MNHQSAKLWATMSNGQRIAVMAAGLVAFGLGIICFFYPEAELLQFHFGLAEIEIYWRPATVGLLVAGLCAIILLLAVWWKHRRRN